MVNIPNPSRSVSELPGSKPFPSSSTTKVVVEADSVMRTTADFAPECLRTFVRASWMTRITWTSQRGDRDSSWSRSLSSEVSISHWWLYLLAR